MNREHFQDLAIKRLSDAKVLLDNEKFDGAYYLSGYVIECALKACVCKQTKEHDFPDKNLANQVHTHDVSKLLLLAGLNMEKEVEGRANPDFDVNWAIVKDWNEKSRYQFFSKEQATDLFNAVSDSDGGILEWIKRYW